MKKFLSLFLMLLMTFSVLISCDTNSGESMDESKKSDTSDTSSETSNNPDNGYLNDDGMYVPKHEVKNQNEREFRVLVRSTNGGTYESNDFTTDSELYGETINDAVEKRNQLVKDDYNVTLKIIKNTTINDDIRNTVNSGLDEYDAVMPTLPNCATFAQEGLFYDMRKIETLDIDAPWWDENATDAFSINDKVYFTTGDITILNKVCSPSILFNKTMITQFNLENPYDLVEQKEWTFEKMYNMAKAATKDTDGVQGMSTNDTWGMLASQDNILAFYGGAGLTLCRKNENDEPYLYLGSEQNTVEIVQEILNRMIETDSWIVYANAFEADIWVNSLNAFADDRMLFRPSAFSATTKLRAYEVDFGIVPVPMWTTDQDDYYSYCGTGEVAGYAIPLSCQDPEFAGYMSDVYACYAKNYLTPAYMEINLKNKDVQDDRDLDMLEIIFDNLVYDVGEVYNFGTVKTFLTSMVSESNPNIVSSLQTIEQTIKDKIDETITNYKNSRN